MSDQDPYPPPSFRDWILLAVAVALTLEGALMRLDNPDRGMVTLVLFGGCTAIAAATIVRKLILRWRPPREAPVVGGVPLRASRARFATFGAVVLAGGAVLGVFGDRYPAAFQVVSWVVAGAGALLLLGVASGRLPAGHLQFDPGGLSVGGRRWVVTVPWEQVAEVEPGEFHQYGALLVGVEDLDAVQVTPPALRGPALEDLASNVRWRGAPVVIVSSHYGIPVSVLAHAVERYAREPAARSELQVRRLPEGPREA